MRPLLFPPGDSSKQMQKCAAKDADALIPDLAYLKQTHHRLEMSWAPHAQASRKPECPI